MSVTFAQSESRLNLMRAFAGESQARNRYTFAAKLAQKSGLHVLHGLFTFTAGQEEQHAKVFYDHLEKSAGENLRIEAGYPVDHYPEVLRHLRAAQHNEYQEWEHDYHGFSKTAEAEGFPDLAHTFARIADIEKTHGDRFGRYADLLEQGKLFVSDVKCTWMCLNCGHVAESTMAPSVCPVCKHPQGYFIRWALAPYGE